MAEGSKLDSAQTDDDKIATLRIIVEQSLEWNSPLYINFIDYENVFDSINGDRLWKMLKHYNIPTKVVSLIKTSYEGTGCRVIHGGQLTRRFEMKTGVRQGWWLFPFLFLLVIDWIMKTCTKQRKNGIQLTLKTQDLDFADDLALLSHSHQQMEKTSELAAISSRLGLNIHKGKT